MEEEQAQEEEEEARDSHASALALTAGQGVPAGERCAARLVAQMHAPWPVLHSEARPPRSWHNSFAALQATAATAAASAGAGAGAQAAAAQVSELQVRGAGVAGEGV